MAYRLTSLTQTLVRSSASSSRRAMPARAFASCSTSFASAAPASASTSSAASPPPSATSTSNLSPKISAIVDSISTLTLLEAADLVDALKTRLNIVDIAMPTASAAASSAAASSGGASSEETAAAAAPKEKTVFNVTLTKIDSAQKAKAIREVKTLMPSMNLVEAKKFVEGLPKTLKENVTKEEAEKLAAAFKAIGCETTLD